MIGREGKVPSRVLPTTRSKQMRRTASVLALTALLVALSPLAAPPASARIARRAVVRCTDCWPTGLAFTPSGRKMFYVERFSGEIRVHDFERGTNRLWGRITNLSTDGEQGLLGIAVHPQWPSARRIFVYYTAADPFQNRIDRLRWDDDGTPTRDNLVTIVAAGNHNGGVIHFGSDGRLYAVTGDAGDPSRSQDTASNAGKVLRMTPGGGAPSDNPFAGEYAFSYGHRNSFGFAFDPQTGRLWQTENGPECNDELNFSRSGRNYGWGPNADCPSTNNSGPTPRIEPEVVWNPVIAPTGAVFCDGCGLGGRVGGRLLVGSWNDGKIRKLRLDAERNDVVSRRLLFDNSQGVLAVESRPSSHRIFFSDPDGIYRLVKV
jgi:glucose/arabinose dehydrogenase